MSLRGGPSCGELQVRIANRFCSDDLDFGSLTAFDFQETRKWEMEMESGLWSLDEVIISVLIRQRSPRATSDPHEIYFTF